MKFGKKKKKNLALFFHEEFDGSYPRGMHGDLAGYPALPTKLWAPRGSHFLVPLRVGAS